MAVFVLAMACKPARGPTLPSTGTTAATTNGRNSRAATRPGFPRGTVNIHDDNGGLTKFSSAARRLDTLANARERAWERLAWMADTYGHRMSGSQALEHAIMWAMETMARDGLENARREKVMVPHWVRGKERARVVSPIERELVLLGLGGTVGTGKRPLRADIVVLTDVSELDKKAAELKGKIVVINQKLPPYDAERRETGYGTTVKIRTQGASMVAKHGAVAVLVRSVTARSLRSPHTGILQYASGVPKIPAAALAVEDTELLVRMAARGPVTVELELGAKLLPDSPSANVVAELPGRELRDEVVVIGGHIDSWDVGDGSTDDGAGCLMAMEAAAMLQELGLVPRRTIRVVLFTGEENGGRGSQAYFENHGHEKHVAAIEADLGSGAPHSFTVMGKPGDVDRLVGYLPLFKPFGVRIIESGYAGTDIMPLVETGTLGVGLRPDPSQYFDLHHSPADTVEKIDPRHLQDNAASMALMAYILAER